MFTLWTDAYGRPYNRNSRNRRGGFSDPFGVLEAWMRELGNEATGNYGSGFEGTLDDDGENLVFTAALPGVKEADIEVNVHHDTLTIRAERKIEFPEGTKLHRRERRDWTFQRSVSLPVPVDAELSKAKLDGGLLTITMNKAKSHQPRRISVTS